MTFKTKRLIITMIALFVLSFIFTLTDSYPSHNPAFELGYSSGQMFRNILKILGVLA